MNRRINTEYYLAELAKKGETDNEPVKPKFFIKNAAFTLLFSLFNAALLSVFLFSILRYTTGITSSELLVVLVIFIPSHLLLANAKLLLILLIKLYQKYASPDLRGACRFTPSCSVYAILALEKFGTLIGLIKTIKRLLRCRYPNGGMDFP